MKKFFYLISKKKFFVSFALAMIFSICEYGTSFALAFYTTSPFTVDRIITLSIVLIMLYIVMNVSHWFNMYMSNTLYPIFRSKIQNYYFNELQNMTFKNVTTTHTGYIYNLIKDVSTLAEDFLRNIEETVLPLTIGTISFLFMACTQSVFMGIICVVISALAIFFKYRMMLERQKYDKKTRVAYSKYVSLFIDFIQNITLVRKLNISDFCNKKMDNQLKNYKEKLRINEIKRANHNTVFHVLIRMNYVIVLLSTIFMVQDGKDALPYLLFYMTLLGNVYRHINNMARVLDVRVQFLTAKKQLDYYFKDNVELEIIKEFKSIELKNVEFLYNNEGAKIVVPYFKVEKGDKISISGESGQGKTTILNILSGTLNNELITINGLNTKKMKVDSVFVSQEADLFDLSIRDNLILNRNISDEKILELLEFVGLLEWYKELPKGLDTIVGEKGVTLSAGQKQRLILIRGILMDKELYFFDEPTSNLDSDSEEKVINTIEKYLHNKTYVIVTHRDGLKRLTKKNYILKNHILIEEKKDILRTSSPEIINETM